MNDEHDPTAEERVTAYVDGALDEGERAEMEALLRERPDLREQAEFERGLRERLRGLPVPELRSGFEMQVRGALRAARRPKRAALLLPLAAALLVVLWARGLPAFVALEVARDHAKCFGLKSLPAKVWSDDPAEIAEWFEKQGSPMPQVPGGVGQVRLVGARYCPLGDRSAPHLYYSGRRHHLSLFVVPGPLRFDARARPRSPGAERPLPEVRGPHPGRGRGGGGDRGRLCAGVLADARSLRCGGRRPPLSRSGLSRAEGSSSRA